ncbi:MAG: hypothetical protein A3E78_02440 [Alphaproteobacteria bacterium RIFCSPHIGHO2_12_FULL_63_12]|nr:MAG: hypothetical protein A3E78_02440 [Alphaproteobacteria bacterium RIFCSPHIGHO2_12_FULL_63_12]
MTKIALVYGAIAGSIVVGSILAGILLGSDHGGQSLWFGYLIMILALSLIFLGVKSYRDRQGGGVIKFGPALFLGLMIAVVAGVFYVGGWEAYLAATDYSFMPSYVDQIIESKKAAGLTGEALAAEVAKLEEMKANYENPLYRMPLTFVEIFPVGLVIAIVSAAILRNPKAFPARGAAK